MWHQVCSCTMASRKAQPRRFFQYNCSLSAGFGATNCHKHAWMRSLACVCSRMAETMWRRSVRSSKTTICTSSHIETLSAWLQRTRSSKITRHAGRHLRRVGCSTSARCGMKVCPGAFDPCHPARSSCIVPHTSTALRCFVAVQRATCRAVLRSRSEDSFCAGNLLEADLELCHLSASHPSIDVFAPHLCIVLYEHACAERAAHMLLSAAEHLETSGQIAEIVAQTEPWTRLTRAGSSTRDAAQRKQAGLRQLAALAALLPVLGRLSSSSLQV
jgi:hypothetical protein